MARLTCVLGELVQCKDGDVRKKMPMLHKKLNVLTTKKVCCFVALMDMVERKSLPTQKPISKKSSWQQRNFKTRIIKRH